jgi:kynurenine formamidase
MTLIETPRVTHAQFEAIRERCSNWSRWGPDDGLGTLNHLTPAHVREAIATVRDGHTLSLAWRLDTALGPDNPKPAEHRFTRAYDVDLGDGGALRLASDYVGIDCHGDAHSHIDALSHVAYQDRLYNGAPPGAEGHSIEALKDGVVGRGVLLDIPRLRGEPWVEPGEAIMPDELHAAAEAQHVALRSGDVLYVRTGHARRRNAQGPWVTATAKAGLHPTALLLLHEAQIAAAGFDGDGETIPSPCDGVPLPIHAIAIASMGLALLDSLNLEALGEACAARKRWEFMTVVAPLRISGGTGSPVNPLAIL